MNRPYGFELGVGALLVASLALVLLFDLGPPVAFNDDWVYAFSSAHIGLNGIARFPTETALALPQEVWGAVATLGNTQEPWLRLTLLPFVLLAAVSSCRLASGLGASRIWALLAGAALLFTPVYLTLASSFMSDIPYLALLLAAAHAGLLWIRDGKARGATIVWSALAALQRQIGLLIPVALTLALILRRKERPITRRDVVFLGAGWGLAGVIAVGPGLIGFTTPQEQHYFNDYLLTIRPDVLWRSVGYVGPTLGLFLLPFMAGILFAPRLRERNWRLGAIAIVFGLLGFVASTIHVLRKESFFPGDIFEPNGFTQTLTGAKPQLFPPALLDALAVLSIGAIVILFVIRADVWNRSLLGVGGPFLLMLAVMQTAVSMTAFIFDRYFLVPAALLIPILARFAAGQAGRAGRWGGRFLWGSWGSVSSPSGSRTMRPGKPPGRKQP